MTNKPRDKSTNVRPWNRTKQEPAGFEPSPPPSDLEKELQLYERIISSTPDLMALIDQSYIFRMVNDAYSSAFGKSREELLGKSVADLVGPEVFRNITKKRLDRAFAGETFTYEGWFELPTPGRRYLAVTYHPVREQDGQISHISVDIRDITDLKLAEGDRQRVFDVSVDMLCVIGFDGYFKELNPSWTKTLGWSQEELKRSPHQDLIHPEDREATIEAEERLLLRQKITGFENRLLCKDGSYRWISWSSVADINRKEIFAVARDVTEQKLMAEALIFSEKKYRTIFDCAGDSLFVHDFAGRFLDVNRVAWEKLGYSREELLNRSLLDIGSPESAEKTAKILAQIEKTGEAFFETCHYCIDGTPLNVWINSRRIEYGAEQAVLSVARDISERKRMEEKLRTLATRDPLTGTSNRRHFMDCARKELLRSRRYGSPLPLLILDIDYFKIINDSYGHDVGDEVLIAVVKTCLATLRTTDIFGRLGGEEFAAVLTQTDAAGAWMTAERLREALAQMTVQTASGPIRLTASIGLAMAQAGDATAEEVMKRADMALYEAKSIGRNRVVTG
jgi:diguanylate cyclase (GGDEF)-like protein/PAS domain S-box-containing protein